jgi:predicted component of viral defense system (DUF524 family)
MESSLTFNMSFYDRRGDIIESPEEWEPVTIKLELDLKYWNQYDLFINSEPVDLMIKKLNGDNVIIAEKNRFNAGHYVAKIKFNGTLKYFKFTVLPSKIAQESYIKMLEEIAFSLPVDIAISLNKMNAFSGVDFHFNEDVSLAQEFDRLKQAVVGTDTKIGLVKILQNLSINPHHILINQDVIVKNSEIRRPNPAKIAHSLVIPNNLDKCGLPLSIVDSRVEHSYNVYENQLVKLFAKQVNIQLRRLKNLFQVLKKEKWLFEVNQLSRLLEMSIRRATFLSEVEEVKHFTLKPTMVLLNVPTYRAAMTGFIEFNKVATINVNDDDIKSPLENTPYLYQKWATMKVLNLLLKKAQELGFQMKKQELTKQMQGKITVKVLPNGKPSVILHHPKLDTIIKFIPERSYINQGKDIRSVSFTQRPDIAIEIIRPNLPPSILILDPKYKLISEMDKESNEIDTKPKKIDIDKMHSYRDAIRSIDGDLVVKFAGILYPGKSVKFGESICAIQAYPTKNQEFMSMLDEILSQSLS